MTKREYDVAIAVALMKEETKKEMHRRVFWGSFWFFVFTSITITAFATN